MSDDRIAVAELLRVSKPGVPHVVSHYLYFLSHDAATEVATRLRALGFTTEERRGADGVNWLVHAKHEMVPSESTIAAARMLMEGFTAATFAGEYDGWEAEALQIGEVGQKPAN